MKKPLFAITLFVVVAIMGELSPKFLEQQVPGICAVVVLDPGFDPYAEADPPYSGCTDALASTRSFGGTRRYGSVGGKVYSVTDLSEQAGRVEVVPVEGAFTLERLRPYLDGAYASDGHILLYGERRVAARSPAVDPAKLGRLASAEGTHPGFVTDGRWVLYEHQVIDGADPASFRPIPSPPGSEKESARYGGERGPVHFGRDAGSVYLGAQRINDADPASFRPVYVSVGSVGLDPGFWALDRSALWRVFDGKASLVDGEEAAAMRDRLSVFSPSWTERWPFLRLLILPGWVLAASGVVVLFVLAARRVRSRYKASLFTPLVGALVTAALVLPTLLYVVFYDSCHAPSEGLVFAFLGGVLAFSTLLLGFANFTTMDCTTAACALFVQVGIVAIVRLVGMIPPVLFFIFSGMPSGGLRACR